MVKGFIARALMTAAASFGKSAFKAFQNVKKGQKAQQAPPPKNPFQEYLDKTLQATNLVTKPMAADEALKILSLDNKELSGSMVMDSYRNLWKKNNPNEGGSFFIQCKIHAAKEFLMNEFPGEEEIYMKEHDVDADTLLSKQERDELQQEQEEEEAFQKEEAERKEKEKKRENKGSEQ